MSRHKKISRTLRCLWALVGVSACVALSGCGGKEAPADTPARSGASAKAVSPTATDTATAATTRPPQFMSMFSTTDPRDPFNPKVKPKLTTSTTTAPAAPTIGPADIIAAVEAGFRGTFGLATERIALVHGLSLEQNRETTLTITLQGAQRRVKVRPIRILRDAMEAQVEGVPNVVTLKVRR